MNHNALRNTTTMSGNTFKAMSGTLQLKANHKWTSYDFKTCGMYFHYFSAKVYTESIGGKVCIYTFVHVQ